MSNIIMDGLSKRIQSTHNSIITIAEALTEEQLSQQPGPTSPPIAWHLWHSSRWADRLQASFQIESLEGTYGDPLKTELWEKDNMVREWELHKHSLGLLQTGPTMTVENAVIVACIGKNNLLSYARRVFDGAEKAISKIDDGILDQSRYSILPELKNIPNEKPKFTGDRQTYLFDDFIFHISHIGRHLGMMEALQGTLFRISGSASI